MILKSWREIIHTDFPDIEITESTRDTTMQASSRYRTDMRLATGRLYADKKYEARRQKILNTPLP